jgi:hypothetical protein
MCVWKSTISIKFKDPTQSKIEIKISPIDTS